MRLRRVFGIGLCLSLLHVSSAYAASISFDSLRSPTNSTVTLTISLTDVTDLVTFGFDLSFDPTILGSPIVSPGTVFDNSPNVCGFCFFPGVSDQSAPGLIVAIGDSLIPGTVPGVAGGILATIMFQTLAAGDAQVALLNVLLQNSQDPGSQGDPGYPLNSIPCDTSNCIQNGVVEVVSPTPVPEPSTLTLLGIGLATLARRFRRKTRAGTGDQAPAA